MRANAVIMCASVVPLFVVLAGCLAPGQDPKTALVRQPGNRSYDPPADLHASAAELWEYAVLSDDVYTETPNGPPPPPTAEERQPPPPTADAWQRACEPPNTAQLPLPGWKRWVEFPSPELRKQAHEVGLYVEVWQRTQGPREVAIAFQGTNSWIDWRSNLRWFLRFIPKYVDQYTYIAKQVGEEFVERFPREMPDVASGASRVEIVATGHSLGGGLAQHFAYSLPASKDGIVPRVSRVYAFDPSPVTGWYSVKPELRTANAKDLAITRVFEHGEILSYIRLIVRYVNPPSVANPSIREIRYNFVDSINPLRSHSMRLLACALAGASHETAMPADTAERVRSQ